MNKSAPPLSDREYLAVWRRRREVGALQALMRRYAPLVHASAYRRCLGDETRAAELTRAVFLVMARCARKLPRKTVLADWLFTVTRLAARKAQPSRFWPWRWFIRNRANPGVNDTTAWGRLAPRFDRAVHRLRRRERQALLLCHVMSLSGPEAAQLLAVPEHRLRKRVQRALTSLARAFRKLVGNEPDALAREIAAHACVQPPDTLLTGLSESIAATSSGRPRQRLARRVLTSLALKRWRRRTILAAAVLAVLAIAVGAIFWSIDSRSSFSRLIAFYLEFAVRLEAYTVPGLAAPAQPWPTNASASRLDASQVTSAAQIYRTTNIWLAHLGFSQEGWEALQPKRIAPLAHFFQPNGVILLRNPKAQRSGLAGVIGMDFHWSHADLEFGGVQFPNVATRLKGNGSHLLSLYGQKRAFKVDLNKYVKGQKLAGGDELTFNNLIVDRSYISEALGYELFREASVPAPRTAYAYLSVSVVGKWERQPLGLYVLVEPVDARFAGERFGSRKTPLFKPVTYQLFEYAGDDWSAYEAIYDLKTESTAEQRERLIDFARLVSQATEAEFAAKVAQFLDLDAFAKFLAGQVILANYDGILMDGQNFYVYLEPDSQRFGFIPWDLDASWGSFPLGRTEERERASIWHPWIGQNKFLERVMAVEEFRTAYRASLEDYLARLFVPQKLFQRIDELAQVIRPAVAAESDFRLQRFDKALTVHWDDPPAPRGSEWADRTVHQMKRFIEKRAYHVRRQLDGNSRGMVLKRLP